MNDTIVDKETYQKNRRMMCWIALALMTASTIAVIVFPARMAEADSIIMAQYLSLSGLVSAYFLLGNKSCGYSNCKRSNPASSRKTE